MRKFKCLYLILKFLHQNLRFKYKAKGAQGFQIHTLKTIDNIFIGCFVTCPIQPSAMYQKLLSVKPQAPERHSQRAVIILLRINCTQRVIQRQQWIHGNSWTNRIPRIAPHRSARRWRHGSWNPYACALTRQDSEHVQWLVPHAGYNQPDSRSTFRSPESDSDKYVPGPRGVNSRLTKSIWNLTMGQTVGGIFNYNIITYNAVLRES